MTELVELPVNLEDCHDPERINARLRDGAAELDWTRVSEAPSPTLASLLDGLDLSRDADALGLETIPEELEDQIVEVLESGGPSPNTPGRSRRSPTGGAPQVFTAERKPLEEPEESESVEQIVEDERILAAPSQHRIRDELQRLVISDLLGPAGGPEEEVTERRVSERYLTGMLAPRRQRHSPEEFDELAVDGVETAEDGSSDASAPQETTVFPSSLGLSFSVAGDAQAIKLTARWGRYRRVPSASLKKRDGSPALVWKREPVEEVSGPLPLAEGELQEWVVTEEQPEVVVRGTVRRHGGPGGEWIVSLFLVNGQSDPKVRRDEAWIFQPELIVESPQRAPIFRQRPVLRDPRKDGLRGVCRGKRHGDGLPPSRRLRRRPQRLRPRRHRPGRSPPRHPAAYQRDPKLRCPQDDTAHTSRHPRPRRPRSGYERTF